MAGINAPPRLVPTTCRETEREREKGQREKEIQGITHCPLLIHMTFKLGLLIWIENSVGEWLFQSL